MSFQKGQRWWIADDQQVIFVDDLRTGTNGIPHYKKDGEYYVYMPSGDGKPWLTPINHDLWYRNVKGSRMIWVMEPMGFFFLDRLPKDMEDLIRKLEDAVYGSEAKDEANGA